MKVCIYCKEEQSLENYNKRSSAKDGKANGCKSCKAISSKTHYYTNKARINAKNRKYYYENPVRFQEYNRNSHLKRTYGISTSIYENMLKSQNYTCKVCGGIEDTKKLNVDHCHTTLKVRGLLCTNCNVALGLAKDDPHTLRKLATYLEDNL